MNEQRGVVEIRRTSDGNPDDVVASSNENIPITVHVERMVTGGVWMNISGPDTDVHMWFRADKDELIWTVADIA